MKTPVTGGTGFIGSHLVDAFLDLGHEVVVLDNFSTGRQENFARIADHIEIVECDLGSKGEWDQNFSNVDWMFHLAALADIVPSIQDPRGGSVCLNSLDVFYKWMPTLVMLQPGLVTAH